MSVAVTARTEIATAESTRPLSPHLEVARRSPFTGPSAPRGRTAAELRGALPTWLRGTLLRVAPMFGASPSWGPEHWFDALAVAGAIELGDSPEVTLRWSVLETDAARAAASGRVPTAHFGSKNGRSFWRRLVQPIPAVTDNTNVNVVTMGDDIVALTESPAQWILDGDLEAKRRPVYDDALGSQAFMLAHPVIENGVVTNIATKLGRHAEVSVYTHGVRERSRHVVGTWTTPELPYIHSFGLTDATAIIVAHPFTARPASLLWSNRGFIDHFSWQPHRGTRLVLIDRATGTTSEVETDPFFTFHVVQAFEDDDAITLDLLAYDDASIVRRLATTSLTRGLPALDAYLTRLCVDKKTRRVTRTRLSDVAFEFPFLDFKLARGRSAEIVYGATAAKSPSPANEVVAVDPRTGTARRFGDADHAFGEPVFVGRPDRTREGDGVLLVLGSAEHAATLFVLDATTLEPIASARFDVPFPLGFHGSFARRRSAVG